MVQQNWQKARLKVTSSLQRIISRETSEVTSTNLDGFDRDPIEKTRHERSSSGSGSNSSSSIFLSNFS